MENIGAEEESEDECEEEEEEEEEENDEPEPQPNEPQRTLEASETSTLPNILTLAQGGQTSWLRKRRILEVDQENLCVDDGCEKTIEEGDLLRCDAPGCGLTVS